MKPIKAIFGIIIALFLVEGVFSEEADYRDRLKELMKTSGVIVDVCVYEKERQPPEDGEQEATLIKRAVVTGVHKGNDKVGTKIDIVVPRNIVTPDADAGRSPTLLGENTRFPYRIRLDRVAALQ